MLVKNRTLLIGFLSFAFFSCMTDEPAHIELGKDYNGYASRIMDTTSSFKLNDPFTAQLYNGKEFGVDSVRMIVSAGSLTSKGPILSDRMIRVKSNSRDLIIRGTQNDPLSARGFLKTSKVGKYVIEFRLGSQTLAQKELSLHNSKE